jgi:hypothetical protein
MAKPIVASEATEVAWLLFASLGVVVLTLIGHAVYRDIDRIVKRLKEILKPRKERLQKNRIMSLIERYSDEDLAKVIFSIAAWPREGYPDNELPLARPPHYRWDLKSGSGQRFSGDTDPALSMEYLNRNTRETLLAIFDAKLTNRSRLTLTWVEQRLTSAHPVLRTFKQGDGND